MEQKIHPRTSREPTTRPMFRLDDSSVPSCRDIFYIRRECVRVSSDHPERIQCGIDYAANHPKRVLQRDTIPLATPSVRVYLDSYDTFAVGGRKPLHSLSYLQCQIPQIPQGQYDIPIADTMCETAAGTSFATRVLARVIMSRLPLDAHFGNRPSLVLDFGPTTAEELLLCRWCEAYRSPIGYLRS